MQLNNLESNQRFSIHWTLGESEGRFIVFVFDKLNQRTVYKSNTKSKPKEYNYIKDYYGTDNCTPPTPEPTDMRKYL